MAKPGPQNPVSDGSKNAAAFNSYLMSFKNKKEKSMLITYSLLGVHSDSKLAKIKEIESLWHDIKRNNHVRQQHLIYRPSWVA